MAIGNLASVVLDCDDLDVSVADLYETQSQALAIGSSLPADQPSPDRWRVLFDPAGHPFCISIQIPEI